MSAVQHYSSTLICGWEKKTVMSTNGWTGLGKVKKYTSKRCDL